MYQRCDKAGERACSQAAVSRDTLEATWKRQLAEVANPLWRPRYLRPRYHRALERFSRLYPQLCALPRHYRRRLQRRLGTSLAGIALVLAMSYVPLAMAAAITVNTNVPGTNSDGLCSLVEAVVNANDDVQTFGDCAAGSGPDTIYLPSSSVHTLTSAYAGGSAGLPIITGNVTIEGNGSTIQRDVRVPDFRIIENKGDLTINNTTISGGYGSAISTGFSGYQLTLNNTAIKNNTGAAIVIYAGSLTINDSTITGNSGVGLRVWYSPMYMNNSVVSNNSDSGVTTNEYTRLYIDSSTFSGNRGGGIEVAEAMAVIKNSTISGSSSGGIRAFDCNLALRNSTVTGNSSSANGGGISIGHLYYPVEISSSIISGNVALGEGSEIFAQDGVGAVKFNSNNVLGHSGISSAEAFAGTPPPEPAPTDVVATRNGTDPTALTNILETILKPNGGSTKTHALVAGSPAIDAAGSDCPPPATDQRGVKRPIGASCDIGAFEYRGGSGGGDPGSAVILDRFTAPDGTDIDGRTPDTLDNDTDWEVVNGTALIQGNALALSLSGPKALALLNAGNVIQEVEFDFTLGGDNAFRFYPLRVGQGETPQSGYGFWINQRHFDFKKYTDGKEAAVRDIRSDFDTQSTYTAKFAVSGKRLSLYIKKAGGAYGADLLNLNDPDYRYLTTLGFASNVLRNEALRIDNVRVPFDPSVRDRDGDGVADPGDAYPGDPSEWADSDGDGVGDNSDAFPNNPNAAKDSDGDGVADEDDAFPNDPNETTDSDGDGVGDKGDGFPGDPTEWADSDGDGIGNNADPFPTIAGQRSLMTGYDLNGDGRDDILWRHRRTGENALWQMDGGVRQAERKLGQITDPNWKIVGAADFSGDGLDDILWHHTRTGGVVVWQMNGFVLESVRSLGVVPNTHWRVVGVGDFNGDTRNDILWRHATSGSTFVWQMNGYVREAARSIGVVADPRWRIVGLGDYNADLKTDLLWRNGATGANLMWLMDGFTHQSDRTVPPVYDTRWEVVGTGDYNADLRADILWRHAASGATILWLMDSTVRLEAGVIKTAGDTNWHVVGNGDHNGDGRADILWRNVSTGDDEIWLMNGLQRRSAQVIPRVEDPDWKVVPVKN